MDDVSVEHLARAVLTMTERFTGLVSLARDPDAGVGGTPAWSVTDLVGHVASEPSRYRALALGGGDWPARVADLPAFNNHQVLNLPSRNLQDLSHMLCTDVHDLLGTIRGFGAEAPLMYFDGGQQVRADLALGTLLGELVVHGYDIARTIGAPWRIDATMVPLVLAGLHQVLPSWVYTASAAGHTATYDMRVRGLASYSYEFTDGQLIIDPAAPRRADVHISADPSTFLLLTYGRVGQPRAALSGKTIAWGRRPWLALRLRGLFLSA